MQRNLISILAIAGSDNSGGAGIQADVRAAALRNVFCSTAITAVTSQSSNGMSGMTLVNQDFLIQQIKDVFIDASPLAIKIGMLGSLDNGFAVTEFLHKYAKAIPIVIDPVMMITAGNNIISDSGKLTDLYVNHLCPLATIVTPNLEEARILGASGTTQRELTASLLNILRCKAVILKGGHSKGNLVTDVLALTCQDSSIKFYEVTASKEYCKNLHGTGCTYSSIVAAELAKGYSIIDAFMTASWLMKSIINQSTYYHYHNSNYGPLNLFNYHTIQS
ncbi:MAG: hydroxymethylpyrimidine/phosphomethylpyrimidine kinase [Bacteroides sp.]|nr:hydroxymethylpyrimidine/phosphomethylpyrimidine kinase [Bacteroides sp.]